MKKYTPSVKNNNLIKEEIVKEMKSFLYKIEKRKYDSNLDDDTVKEVLDANKNELSEIEGIIFTGEEDLSIISEKVFSSLEHLKKSFEQEYTNKLIEASDDFSYQAGAFKAISSGEIDYIDEKEEKAKRLSFAKKKLYGKLTELEEIKDGFNVQDKRLEKDIEALEKDLAELDDKMLNEDNERSINELYRKISALKSKLDMLNIRRSNYSACFNVLDIIYANANEIMAVSEFSEEEIGKAKALLNINKLKSVINEPEKAMRILKIMEKDIKQISERVSVMDEKVFGLKGQETIVSESALAYKEELMRKKREKEANADSLTELESKNLSNNDIKGEN